jgi:cytochrome c
MKLSMIEKILFCLIGTFWFIWSVNWIGDTVVQAGPLKTAVFKAPAKAIGEKAPAEAAAETTETAPGALAMLASADAGVGKKAFKKCKACHSSEKGGKKKVGPNLWDIVGKAKATGAGFGYSDALKGLGGAWTYQDLNGFLADPKGFAKGTKMGFRGVKKAKDRAAIIVYLRSLSDQPKPLP